MAGSSCFLSPFIQNFLPLPFNWTKYRHVEYLDPISCNYWEHYKVNTVLIDQFDQIRTKVWFKVVSK